MVKKINSLDVRSALTAILFIVLSIPAFSMTGFVLKPLLVCTIGSIFVCFLIVKLFSKASPAVCSNALLLFELFWLTYCFLKEISLQLQYGFPGKWIEFFYFDKLLMVGTIWLVSTVFFTLLRIFQSENCVDYRAFYKINTVAFIIFYSFLLIYSFVLIRLERGTYPLNWIPFNTVREYIKDSASIPYEVFMMFFGNLLYFTPLGMVFYHKLKKISTPIKLIVFIFFPLLAFSLLEFSQYFFQNGFCEFDDMMMNTVGFWLGVVVGFAADKAVFALSKGKISSFWG